MNLLPWLLVALVLSGLLLRHLVSICSGDWLLLLASTCRLVQKDALGCSSCSSDWMDGEDGFFSGLNSSNTLSSSPPQNIFLHDFISRLSSCFSSSFSVDADDDDDKWRPCKSSCCSSDCFESLCLPSRGSSGFSFSSPLPEIAPLSFHCSTLVLHEVLFVRLPRCSHRTVRPALPHQTYQGTTRVEDLVCQLEP